MTEQNKLPVREIEGVEFPDYGQISMENWSEMIERAMEQAEQIWKEARDSEIVNLSTTFMALERSHAAVQRVLGPFALLVDGGDQQAGLIHEKVAGKLAQAQVRHLSDPKFAARCQDALSRLGGQWPKHQRRAAEMWLLQMRLNGSLLENDEARARLGEIASRSAELESQFQQMISQSCNGEEIFTEKQLDGVDVSKLPKTAGGEYIIRMIREPVDLVLESCRVRSTRERVMKSFEARGTPGDIMGVDTGKIIEELLELRSEKAQLLGFENYAELKLAETMARTPQAAQELLLKTWNAIEPGLGRIIEDIQAMASEDGIDQIMAWDTAFYAKKIQDEAGQVEDGATLGQTRRAMLELAERLFGLSFEPVDVSCPWEGMAGWIVRRDGNAIGGMLTDFMEREGKPSGAWMHLLLEGHKMGKGQLPVVANTCNFGGRGDEAKLSPMEVRTAFHEFGHALHGLLGRTHLPSQSGTNTLHDWVELPSQLLENWVMDEQCTRELGLPDGVGGSGGGVAELIQKARYLQSAMLDLEIHTNGTGSMILADFEKGVLREMRADECITPWHRLSHFSHLFSGDMYSAGYYAYLWAEVLDADVFQRSKKEDPLARSTGERLERYIYSAGDEHDPAELFEALMGRKPDPAELLRRMGLEEKASRPAMMV